MTPRELYLEVTNRCQSLCISCPITFGGHEPRRDMTMSEAMAVVDQAPGVRRVVLHGVGEPLLNKELPALVAELSGRGLETAFNTNAIALTLGRGQALIDAGLSEMRVSIDGARPETYHRIRGVDALDRVVRNLRAFLALRGRDRRPSVVVTFMAMAGNLEELPDVVRLAADAGADGINVQRLVWWDGAGVGPSDALYGHLAERQRELLEQVTEIAYESGLQVSASGGTTDPVASLDGSSGKRSACRRPWTSAYVTAHGKVLACCIAPFTEVPFDDLVLGDLRTQSLDEVWSGARYEGVRRGLLDGPPAPFCEGCGERWSV